MVASGKGVVVTPTRGQWGQAPRSDTATVTAGSPTVLDASIRMGDDGRIVSGTGIPAGAVVGHIVVSGADPSTYQFSIMVNGTVTNATAGASSVEVGGSVAYYVDLPSTEFNALPQGKVMIYVHGQDAAGNWNSTWTHTELTLDKTGPLILDHSTSTVEPDPVVTHPTALTYTLSFWAQDPTGNPPPCTVNTITPLGCGLPVNSTVKEVEWTIDDINVIDIGQKDFTLTLGGPGGPSGTNLVPPSNGPFRIDVDLSGGPSAPYAPHGPPTPPRNAPRMLAPTRRVRHP
jgi:hypothetical protein